MDEWLELIENKKNFKVQERITQIFIFSVNCLQEYNVLNKDGISILFDAIDFNYEDNPDRLDGQIIMNLFLRGSFVAKVFICVPSHNLSRLQIVEI